MLLHIIRGTGARAEFHPDGIPRRTPGRGVDELRVPSSSTTEMNRAPLDAPPLRNPASAISSVSSTRFSSLRVSAAFRHPQRSTPRSAESLLCDGHRAGHLHIHHGGFEASDPQPHGRRPTPRRNRGARRPRRRPRSRSATVDRDAVDCPPSRRPAQGMECRNQHRGPCGNDAAAWPFNGMDGLRPRSQVDVGCRAGFRLSGRATVAGGLSE